MKINKLSAGLAIAALAAGVTLTAALPANAAVYAHSVAAETTLKGGDSITSSNGEYTFDMQTDGNAVEYGIGGKVLWDTNTAGNSGATLHPQSDGNLVLYSAAGKALWQSGTGGGKATSLALGTDGNIVMYNGSASVWASYSTQHTLTPGNSLKAGETLRSGFTNTYTLDMQSDGNLVEYGPANQVEWESKTNNNPGAYADFQTDGNFVIYSAANKALWQTVTANTKPADIDMQADGNAVMYETDGSHLWNTHGVPSTSNSSLGSDIASLAEANLGKHQDGPNSIDGGDFDGSNGYTNAWCSLFLKWVWQHAGVGTAHMTDITALAASLQTYGQDSGTWSGTPRIGSAVVFESTPGNESTGEHVGIVVGISGGNITVVNGDYGVSTPPTAVKETVSTGGDAVGDEIYGQTIGGYAAPIGL